MDANVKFCTKCGAKLKANDVFCTNCGSRSESVNTAVSQPAEVMPQEPLSYQPSAATMQTPAAQGNLSELEKIKKEFFSWEGRLGRMQYFKRILALMAVDLFAVLFMIALITAFSDSEAFLLVLILPLLLIFFFCSVAGWILGIKRCHDINKSGWFLVLTFVPCVGFFISLYILFAKGTVGPNLYGPDPLAGTY